MSVIIRLQNLPWSANALDIRQYFHGLSIPEGGVHIVGGELGDAFIAFSTDEDARQAFNLNNGKIKEVQIKLMLSSRTQMQKVIEAARNQSLAAFMQNAAPSIQMPPILPAVIPSAVPELQKDSSRERDSKDLKGDKREKRRSRSRSRDRKDRSRDRDRRDRRHRERSRSRSRDRRDRRRRDRSRSRDRTRSRDRDRKVKDIKRSEERAGSANPKEVKSSVGIWETPQVPPVDVTAIPQPLLTSLVANSLEEARRNLNALNAPQIATDRNGFQNQRNNFNRQRENWPVNSRGNNRADFPNRNESFNNTNQVGQRQSLLGNYNPNFTENRGFNRGNLSNRPEGTNSRFDRQDPERPTEIQTNSCIQLRPFFGGYGEIRRFFQGIFINNTGIKFVNDEYGKRTGIIYIRFAFPEGKEQALQRHGGILRNQQVEISHLDDEVFESTIDRFQPDSFHDQQSQEYGEQGEQFNSRNKNQPKYFNSRQNQGQSLKVYTCLAVEDLPSFAKEQDVFKLFSDFSLESILMTSKPRNNHVAYIKFCNADDAKKAYEDKSKHIFEGKPVTVRPCKDEEFEAINNPQEEIEEIEDENIRMINTDCITLSGLPMKVTDRDVSDFFSDVGVVPAKIHLISNHLGFTGQAYCEFASEREASIAMEKDSTPLGTNVITVAPVSRQKMVDMILGNQILSNNAPALLPAPILGPRPFFPRNNFGSGPRGPNFNRVPGRRFHPPPSLNPNDAPMGCTVLMENVPYKAGLDEILEYFDGFDIPNDNVLRRFNDNGTPSGEAKVIFSTPDEAFQAMQEKRGHKIRDRLIYLTQC